MRRWMFMAALSALLVIPCGDKEAAVVGWPWEA